MGEPLINSKIAANGLGIPYAGVKSFRKSREYSIRSLLPTFIFLFAKSIARGVGDLGQPSSAGLGPPQGSSPVVPGPLAPPAPSKGLAVVARIAVVPAAPSWPAGVHVGAAGASHS